MKPLFFFSAIVLVLFNCAPPSPRAESVLSLAPPTEVSINCESDSCQISWRASEHADEEKFAGYKIYVSKTSLLFVSPKDLPQPVTVDKTHGIARIAKPERTVFVHVRSYTIDGKVSLPSLPELQIEKLDSQSH